MENYITFSVPIKKEPNSGKTVTYKVKFIDRFRFMSTSLSELVDNTSGIQSKECKSCVEFCFVGLTNNRLIYKCKECREECKKPINELKEKFAGIYQFCNGDLNKFVLLLKKGVYSYEYMDRWEKYDEHTLPLKKDFYSNLNLEDISDEDYTHAQKVWNTFKIKKIIIKTLSHHI